MSTCVAGYGDDSFISGFNKHQHWTFSKHNHIIFVSLNGLISRDWGSIILNIIRFPTANLPASFLNACCMHNICHKFVFSLEYTKSWTVKICCLSAVSETTCWSVSVYLSLSDLWLHTNWGSDTMVLWSGRIDSLARIYALVYRIRWTDQR